ncbi:MAG: hypothetical protein FWC91_12605 [Defluviitaleaceae bacterium]|nr:hypothetical protein [Defluviitaleaceae bacterium]
MGKKFLLTLVMATCLCAMPTIAVSAAQATQNPGMPAPASSSADEEWQKLQNTWDALSKKQKEQLYKAREAIDKADCNFIDKAVECNLLEKEIGEKMKEHIKARTAAIRQEGDIPIFRRAIRQKQ